MVSRRVLAVVQPQTPILPVAKQTSGAATELVRAAPCEGGKRRMAGRSRLEA